MLLNCLPMFGGYLVPSTFYVAPTLVLKNFMFLMKKRKRKGSS